MIRVSGIARSWIASVEAGGRAFKLSRTAPWAQRNTAKLLRYKEDRASRARDWLRAIERRSRRAAGSGLAGRRGLLAAAHDHLFPLTIFGVVAGLLELLLGLGGELAGLLLLLELLLVVFLLDLRGALEVLDASAQRVADLRQLVGAEHDEDDDQDDE